MSHRPLLIFSTSVITAGSMAGNLTSTAQNLDFVNSYCIQTRWTGTTPVGTLSFQLSNDGTNYTEFRSLAVSGNTGSDALNVEIPAYSWVQVVYTRTSGTGTMNMVINGKQG